ncbi:MAG: alkaline phosphatase family protein [Proteobacteria bacterium]|nr:alkaline phosphatase family protein [Pseudomonadota bacterium]
MADTPETVTVNGRDYAWPDRPVVVVCIDGSEPDYIERAVADGAMPFLGPVLKTGSDLRADCVIPSFTNPNNMSIVTGVPPVVHGIAANFFHDRESGEDVMTNTPKFLWVDTIFKAFFDAGAKIAIVTAKDKLTSMLGHGLDFASGRAVHIENADALLVKNARRHSPALLEALLARLRCDSPGVVVLGADKLRADDEPCI